MAAYTTIDDPSAYFKVQLYTGNGSANHAITFDDTDTDMQPDFVWIKNRDATDAHCLFDSVRGATKVIHSDGYAVEATDTDTLDSFTSDGFQVDADDKVNTNTEKYVAWCWKANGTGSSNTAGSINTTATSAETTSGFSIIHFTGNLTSGATIGHGIGIAPHFIITKSLDAANDWGAFHIKADPTAPEDKAFKFNTTAAVTDQVAMWNDTLPSSTLVTLGDEGRSNDDEGMIAYCFAPVQGFSKFGTYEGNGNADGTFVYTGFRPAFIMTKSVDSTSAWHMFDNKREGSNVDVDEESSLGNDPLVADATTAEATTAMVDMLSNGFKFIIAGDPNVAETYVYMAFAEAPFVNSNGVPCNAR